MKLIELLPLIVCNTVNIYEKRKYRPSRFIVLINPKKIKGCISDDLLDREIYSISIGYRGGFNINVCSKKDDKELVEKAASIGLIEDVNNDDSDTEYGDKFESKEEKSVVEHDRCRRCKYEHDSAIDEPCVSCCSSTNHFEPKEHNGCLGCLYEDFEELEEPCVNCKGAYKHYTMAYLKAKDCYVRKVDKRKE